MGALRSALRDATRESHHVIDHHPLVAPLVRADIGLDAYACALRGLLCIHRPLQRALANAIAQTGLNYELADRVGWLMADLESLGISERHPGLAWKAPSVIDAASLAGVLYVVEGSTLGGQVIARRIESSLGLTAAHGARFFNGWGSATENRWLAFWDFAEFATGNDAKIAIEAALACFEAIRLGFDEFLIAPSLAAHA